MPDTPSTLDETSKLWAAFAGAKASLALEGLHPTGPLYEQVRADVIASRMSFDEAAQRISESFGPDVCEDDHIQGGSP